MLRWPYVIAGIFIGLAVCSCVVSDGRGNGGVTCSDEEFRMRYPGLSLAYYDRMIEIETLTGKGKKLYDRYYTRKGDKNQVDYETMRHARRILNRAHEAVWKVYKETEVSSVLSMRQKISTMLTDLLREVEEHPEKQAPDLPK